MLIENYKVTKSISVRKKEFKILISTISEKIEYRYSGKDVFSGDYWNSLFIGNELFDLNLYKSDKFKIVLYKIENDTLNTSSYYCL